MGKALQIISEPEAAAIYALHAMDPHSIQVGDTFVLCDAGGGTVDLISYTVSALKPILQVEEAAMGSGRICGSTFLNRIFQKFLVDKLGLNEEWVRVLDSPKHHIYFPERNTDLWSMCRMMRLSRTL